MFIIIIQETRLKSRDFRLGNCFVAKNIVNLKDDDLKVNEPTRPDDGWQ